MEIIINDTTVNIPTTLSEFTLGQRIDFYNLHGRQLDEMAKSIMEMPDDLEREIEASELYFHRMFKTFAFFANCTPEAVEQSAVIDGIAELYHTYLSPLFEDDIELIPEYQFTWNNDVWVIPPAELKHGSSMQFGELIDSKQIVKDMIEQAASKWEYMLPICAIFLRKKGEAYDESFLYEGSERLELMKSLPMDIAMQVAFFFTRSMNLLQSPSQSFNHQGSKAVVSIQGNTLTVLDGSIFSKALQKRKYSIYREYTRTLSNVPGKRGALMY